MKNVKYLLVASIYFLIQCSNNSDINTFKVEYFSHSNFSIMHAEMHKNEQLVITVNDKFIYKYGPKNENYTVVSNYKLPEIAKKIEVRSIYKKKTILCKTFFDTSSTSKKLIISVAYPRKYDRKDLDTSFRQIKEVPIEESVRYIYIKHY
ncbi:hypothetical protein D0817_14905 [Flavobacterium cupreum]|uniref:Uncharacterized protein n=1 Tax=Flavobacterium cupreum TaxID=2133766 RepID=A0A434A663_9FLAO|nr:hypothetical protein [Flavobacterium cupreum]RUT69901.1 hypothetical protein D0817_14905 [Flavobacterium cupreum]